MKNNPTFSIILTTYNRAHLLPKAITSVLSQSYENFELLIINGGSSDNTNQVVHSYHDQRIKYLIQDEDHGVQNSRNLGLDTAKGKYIYFLDDDDELIEGALELIIQLVDNLPSKDFKFFWFDAVDAETNTFSGTGLRSIEKNVAYPDLLCGRIYGDFATVQNREAFGTNRFDERLWGYEGLLWLKLHKECDGYYFPRVILKKYRQHGIRMCNTSKLSHLRQYILGENIFIKEFGGDLKMICPNKYAEHLSMLGYYQLLNGEKNNARENIFLGLRYRFSIIFLIFYILSYVLSKQRLIFLCKIFKKI